MNPAPKRRPGSVATSPAIPGRRIGRADGPDRASFGHFAKKFLIFNEINPQSSLLSQTFLRKNPKLFPKQPAVQPRGFRKIYKETLKFS
jgi:hypothetical protein